MGASSNIAVDHSVPFTGRDRSGMLADLFAAHAGRFSPDETAALDGMLLTFSARCGAAERTEFAARLARLDTPPPATLRALARDDVAIGGSILAGSESLDDQDLIAIAVDLGPDHMSVIAGRRMLSPAVTDVLIELGTSPVWGIVAGNAGARLSRLGAAGLIERSSGDATLQDLLGQRRDLTDLQIGRLVTIVAQEARARLRATLAELPDAGFVRTEEVSFGLEAGLARARRDYAPSLAGLRAHEGGRPLTEQEVVTFATRRETEHALCAVAAIAGLPIVVVEDMFDAPQPGMLLVVARAKGWDWRTAKALLRLREPSLPERHAFRAAAATFDALSSVTAGRVLRFVALQGRATLSPARRKPR